MKHIFDPSFSYIPAAATDLKKTFARIRKEQKAQSERQQRADDEAKIKTVTLNRRTK